MSRNDLAAELNHRARTKLAMDHPLDSVVVRPRKGSVPAATSHLSWEVLIQEAGTGRWKLLGNYATEGEANTAAQNRDLAAKDAGPDYREIAQGPQSYSTRDVIAAYRKAPKNSEEWKILRRYLIERGADPDHPSQDADPAERIKRIKEEIESRERIQNKPGGNAAKLRDNRNALIDLRRQLKELETGKDAEPEPKRWQKEGQEFEKRAEKSAKHFEREGKDCFDFSAFKPEAKDAAGFRDLDPETASRQELIAHIRKVAKQWGIKQPDITDKSTDEYLRGVVRRMFKSGEDSWPDRDHGRNPKPVKDAELPHNYRVEARSMRGTLIQTFLVQARSEGEARLKAPTGHINTTIQLTVTDLGPADPKWLDKEFEGDAAIIPNTLGYVVARIGPYRIVEGIGTNGGEWFTVGEGRTVRFANREEAEQHARMESGEDAANDGVANQHASLVRHYESLISQYPDANMRAEWDRRLGEHKRKAAASSAAGMDGPFGIPDAPKQLVDRAKNGKPIYYNRRARNYETPGANNDGTYVFRSLEEAKSFHDERGGSPAILGPQGKDASGMPWEIKKIGGEWYACGTSALGKYVEIKFSSRDGAARHANMMNKVAKY